MVLLDRDGVLNEDRPDYVRTPDQLVLIDGSAQAVARLNRSGVKVVVVTNQGGVGREVMDLAMLEAVHTRLREELAYFNAHLDDILFCADHPEHPTDRRKPAPGMIREALVKHGGEAAMTPMVGDSLRDMEAAAAMGCPRHLVRTGHGIDTLMVGFPQSVEPVRVHDDLDAVVEELLLPRGPAR